MLAYDKFSVTGIAMLTSRRFRSNKLERIKKNTSKLQKTKWKQTKSLQDDIVDVELTKFLNRKGQFIRSFSQGFITEAAP